MGEQKFKRSYKFAFFSSLYITLFLSVFLLLIEYIFFEINWQSLLIFTLVCYVLAFLVIQLRIEHFIYKRVKAVYDSVTLLDSSLLQEERVTTDMATLTKEVEKFARDKKIEIERLRVRENYRKEFMGNVSHELKTPLFTVQGYILTLLDGALKDKKVRKKYLKRASKGVDRLLYIVNDLDMITKLEAGDLHLYQEDFDIVKVIKNVFELLEMKADKKEINLSFDKKYQPTYVNADEERIQQVLTNLIVNSIKYGKKGGTTEVSIEHLPSEKNLIRITDNGEGIKHDHLPRLFERFYRVDKSGSRNEGGSGLGLSIVKHIIEAHDEKIYVESDYGVGSEFSFTIKKAKASSEAEVSVEDQAV
mgnify:CR=1 FL=1